MLCYVSFSAIEREYTNMGLYYILSTSRDVWRINSLVTVYNYTLDTVKEFIYLAVAVTTKNYVSLEIKWYCQQCYYGLNGKLNNSNLSGTTKLILYKTLILLCFFMAQRYGFY